MGRKEERGALLGEGGASVGESGEEKEDLEGAHAVGVKTDTDGFFFNMVVAFQGHCPLVATSENLIFAGCHLRDPLAKTHLLLQADMLSDI